MFCDLIVAMLNVLIVVYSYKILIVPASKVSVPLTVVMRTRSRVPERVTEPELLAFNSAKTESLTLPD